ncbi:MAG TPA: tripartite tricarboxylate transporter substrate-binding protein [Burkholderiales bacterium]|nr:tripartite tricarboxylate transporter substrate-binding protein [Burkholderiales bacterium]
MRTTLAVLLGLFVVAAHAQTFPAAMKPVRIVVPFPPGGQTDIQARAIAARMAEQSGLSVYVDNRPGGSTLIGAREVQKSPPDGHTLLYTIATHVQIPHLFREPPWDAFRDFTPITTGARSATVLTAHASVPFNTVAELVDYAKRNPGRLNFASFGAGSTAHLNGELFKRLAGIDIVHVPYKGSGDAMKDHLTGTVQLFFDGPTTAISNAKTGKVKLIATAAETRKQALPDVPTMREQGYDVGMWGYLWFWGPGGMPPATVEAVYQHLARAIQHASVRDLFAAGGSEASGLPPADMNKVARELDRRWGEIIRAVGVKLDN